MDAKEISMEISQLWWTQIPGPRAFCRGIARQFRESSVCCLSCEFMPWQDAFRSAVLDRIYASTGSVLLDLISQTDMDATPLLPLLAQHLGLQQAVPTLSELKNAVPASGLYLWLCHLSARGLQSALAFQREAEKIGLPLHLLVECEAAAIPKAQPAVIRYSAQEMDILYLALTLLMDEMEPSFVEYAAHLLTSLAKGDPLRMETLFHASRECLVHPLECAPWLTDVQCTQAVYNAQIRILLPLIENVRLQLIQSYQSALSRHLPFMDEYLGTYQKPAELELRHLVYFLRHGDLPMNPRDESILNLLYEARNLLSHIEILPFASVEKLLQMA